MPGKKEMMMRKNENEICKDCRGDGLSSLLAMTICVYCQGKGYKTEDDLTRIEEDRGYGIKFG